MNISIIDENDRPALGDGMPSIPPRLVYAFLNSCERLNKE
jgi:hypothetical protein